MKRKLKNKKGFTLAELLIVVAIIAVLVAISIPIFSSQLEKAREATDAANIRSAYAELSADAITGDEIGTAKEEGNVTINASSGDSGSRVYTATIKLTQQQDGWQTAALASGTIGGISAGSPTKKGTATLTIYENGDKGTLTYA